MKKKAVNYAIVPSDHEAYAVLRDAREHHPALQRAKILLAWRKRTKANRDGLIVLGRCVKASDLQKELAEWDFVLVLNEEFWHKFDAAQRLSLFDHELCHARPQMRKGMHAEDERGRPLWRLRKHDIEEFREVIERHGCYKADLELFARAIAKQDHSLKFEFPPEVAENRIEFAQ